ncbi:MAG: ribbon-helix-helix domain-containing protein [Candidatus Woesearchaeota archaeon]
MKERISVTLDKEIIIRLKKLLKSRKYRNKSHAVETAIVELLKYEENITEDNN